MKILYFGTVCNIEEYERKLRMCSERPSMAPIVFESSLLKGFKNNNVLIDVYSFPMIPTWPKSKYLFFRNEIEKLSSGYECIWLKTINLPIIKQITRRFDGKRVLNKWLNEHQGEKCCIVTYSIPPFLVRDVLRLSSKYNVKCIAIVTDLLRDMYLNEKNPFWVKKLKDLYLNNAIKLQGKYDGYIYLTEAMRYEINPIKPYIIMEGIADVSSVNIQEKVENIDSMIVMYAGRLEERYGILNLIDAFEMANLGNVELWLLGNGNLEDKILLRAKHNPKICFLGVKPREEVLVLEKKASLLVNVRDVNDEFTKYSFPSKTIEYMLSGTPVLTTRLKGIPEEYYQYMYTCTDNKVETICNSLRIILNKDIEERMLLGNKAKEFIINNKNSTNQTRRILKFLEGMYDNQTKS